MKKIILLAITLGAAFAMANDSSSLDNAPRSAAEQRAHRDATFEQADQATHGKKLARVNRNKTMKKHKKHGTTNETNSNGSFNSGPASDAPDADSMGQTKY